MRIGGTSGIGNGFGIGRRDADRRVQPIADTARPQDDDARQPTPASTALVPLAAPVASESPIERLVRWHGHAPFLAHLIADREALPETRRRRRATPARAARAYGEAMEGRGLLVPGYFVDVAR